MNDCDAAREALEKAIATFKRTDANLVKYNVQERTMMARLAIYLQAELDHREWLKVDCEYNRDAWDTKQFFAEHLRKLRENEDGELIEEGRIVPDIIVHKRGPNSANSNVLVVEIKKVKQTETDRYHDALTRDRQRLKHFTVPTGQFKYQLGCLLLIDQDHGAPRIGREWYRDGACDRAACVVC